MSTKTKTDRMVLVTGANGFVGSRVVRRLVGRGDRVRALLRATASPSEPEDPRIERVTGDFVDRTTAAAAARGVDAVVHCAATAGPDLEATRRVNAEGTRSMVEAALAAGVRRYIQISTVSVYQPSGSDPVREDAPLKDSGPPYGWTKAEADRIVLEAMDRGLPAVILRPGAVLGVHPTSTWAVKFPERVRDRALRLRGDGSDTVPWVHAEDLADAVLLALDDDRAVGRVYNVVDGHFMWREYTDEVRRWFGTAPLETVPPDDPAAGSSWSAPFDASRIRAELGYAPRRGYEEGMAEAAAHWKAPAPSSAAP